jgi:hypothetical protein
MDFPGNFDCGCEVRKETIGEKNWWNIATIAPFIALLALSRGGKMAANTRKILYIAALGAISALLVDGVVKPNLPKP